ncbi:MAG: hypothetical protein BMS9Abin39_0312 [Ignavibacteria bacterium]|nr:MAG: hypothetical protein BMS9Abin39_0312 [Ignavibacteria bacterium]
MVNLKIPILLILSIVLFDTAKPQENQIIVQVNFDEWMDTTGFTDPNNFVWTGGLVTTDVELIDTALAVLTVSMPVNVQWYSVEVFNVYDLAGNLINPEQDTTGFMWIGSPLPVELTSFTAKVIDERVYLNWITKTEVNNYGFEIESKQVEDEWRRIGFIEGYGTTSEPKKYSFIDKITEINTDLIKYRLKQIDYDGSYEYSDEVLVDNPAPLDYTLQQNYPNPFNPVTTISYSLPVKSEVELVIYNALGEGVMQLANEEKEAGRYSVRFNATELASGIYFYRLQAGEFVETKKMVLLR